MNSPSIKIETEVKPTEDVEKVKQAILNLVSNPRFDSEVRGNESFIIAKASGEEGLSKLQSLLKQERIRDAARKVFLEGISGSVITFHLNKQAAYVNHISFCKPKAESPLGPIKVEIASNNPEELIDWLTREKI
ncbi:MAG TPA: RNA-binding domain-containing protein [archaeon]|nr:RNA-binding domain-containing protein [archaeon]